MPATLRVATDDDLAPIDAAVAQQVLAPALVGEVGLQVGERLGEPRDDGVVDTDRHPGRRSTPVIVSRRTFQKHCSRLGAVPAQMTPTSVGLG